MNAGSTCRMGAMVKKLKPTWSRGADGVEGRAGRIAGAGIQHDPPTRRIFKLIFVGKKSQ